MSRAINEFVSGLLKCVPELRSRCEEHLRLYQELLAHVFFGDVTRYVVEELQRRPVDHADALKRLFDYLEGCLDVGDDADVENVIAVSFVENLIEFLDALPEIKRLMGPRMREVLSGYDVD